MNSGFTINPAGNALVAEHMKIIGGFIAERLGENFVALVLAGSFGRGEGSIIVHDNGRIEVLNDYDFFIIHKKMADLLPRKLVSEWESECAKLTGIRWVDFFTVPEYYLSRMPISQLNFDLKWGGQVVAGREDVLDSIPEFQQEDIRLRDALDLLNTRFWCFIGTKPQTILEETEPLTQEDYLFALQQMSKALMACGESILILGRQYAVKYSEKARIISSLPAISVSERLLIGWAYSYKLGQTEKAPEGYTLRSLFLEALDIHLKTWNQVQQKTSFFKGRLFARFYSGIIQLFMSASFEGFRAILLDKIQLRILRRIRNAPLVPTVKRFDSVLLWLYCRKWLMNRSSYAAKVAELRIGL